MKKITRLYFKYEEFINYIIVGVLTTIVSLGTYYSLRYLVLTNNSQIYIQLSNFLSFIVAVIFSYILNHLWVFQSTKRGKEKRKEFTTFFISRTFTLLIDVGLMFVLPVYLKIPDKRAKLIVQVIITVANYLIGKNFVFQEG